jgi:hypothetical protein
MRPAPVPAIVARAEELASSEPEVIAHIVRLAYDEVRTALFERMAEQAGQNHPEQPGAH